MHLRQRRYTPIQQTEAPEAFAAVRCRLSENLPLIRVRSSMRFEGDEGRRYELFHLQLFRQSH